MSNTRIPTQERTIARIAPASAQSRPSFFTTNGSSYKTPGRLDANQQPLANALREISKINDPGVAKQARWLIDSIAAYSAPYVFGAKSPTLPALNAYTLDDGSLCLEWATSDYRVGFGIEREPSESGWYFVSGDKFGNLNTSGQFDKSEESLIVYALVSLVLSNS